MAIHRIRLRGPWQYEPRARWEFLPDGTRAETDRDLPPAGMTAVPSDWSQTPLGIGFHGRVRHRRTFARPTRLEPHETVFLVVEAATAVGHVRLNGTPLGVVRGSGRPGRFDITTLLRDRNELLIDVAQGPDHPTDQPVQPGGLTGEVRLEISGK